MDIGRVVTDDMFEKAIRAISDGFKERIGRGGVSRVPPELFLFTVDTNNHKDIVGSIISKLPDRDAILREVFEHIGSTAAEKMNALPFMAVVVTEENFPRTIDAPQEAIVVAGVTLDGRSLVHNLLVDRDGENNLVFSGEIASTSSRTAEALPSVFRGAAAYIASRIIKEGASGGFHIGSIARKKSSVKLPGEPYRPGSVEFSKN